MDASLSSQTRCGGCGIGQALGELAQVCGKFGWGFDLELGVEHANDKSRQLE